jgi:hypothetical protein
VSLARADLLTRIRAEIDSRMRELEPLRDEYGELQSILELLAQGLTAPVPVAARARASARARARASASPRRTRAGTTARRGRGASTDIAGQAILAALEHGSHTVAELVVVTAMPAPAIRDSLRRLRARGAVVKTDRDGRAAYALPARGA